MTLLYLDCSALTKLVLREPESAALRAYLEGDDLVSSELVLTELPRAVRRAAGDDARTLRALLRTAGGVLDALALARLDRAVLLAAGAITEPTLRALDAIHVATAVDVAPVDAFVTYDQRQAAVATLAGFQVVAPV